MESDPRSHCWAPLLGPFAFNRAWQAGLGLLFVVVAGLLLHVGGLAVWVGLGVSARHSAARGLGGGLLVYGLVWFFVAPYLAAQSGRRALPCVSGPLEPHSLVYCAANRHYVRHRLADAAERIAARVAAEHPGTVVRYLDGGFPMGLGFPMLPHLSHGDGQRLDLALLWQHHNGSPAYGNGSPVGYFGYAPPPTGVAPACPPRWLDLRWDMESLQPLFAQNDLDVPRTRALLRSILADPAIGKVLLEPHVRARLSVSDDRIRFQGCRAARHDDHVHIQL